MHRLLLLGIVLTLALGCGETSPPGPVSTAQAPVASPPPPPPPPPASSAQRENPTSPADETANEEQYSVSPVAPNSSRADQPSGEVQKAEAGVGRRGRGYGGGIITEPIHQYFHMRERINFIALEHAMKLFEAEHNRRPKSHEEFMRRIIKEGSISLPELPQGEEYFYDPEKGELMIRRPAR